MKIFLNYLWRLWMILLGMVLTSLFFVPVYLLSFRKQYYRYTYRFVRIWCFGMFFGMGMRYKLLKETQKKIARNRQYVIIANHTSLMDIMLPVLLFPHHPICFVGKKELVKIPIFGTIYKRICVMVDRKSVRSRAEVYKRCAERMEMGDSIVIFPEGGVPDDKNIILDSFKDGAFILSQQHQVPIAVYTFIGLKKMFPFDHSKGYPGTVKVIFNDILEPSNSVEELKSNAHQLIKSSIEKYL